MEGKPGPRDIDAYIAGFPPDVQEILQRVRALIHRVVPEAEEAISYQIPTFRLNGNLVHFAAYPKHVALYPRPREVPDEALRQALAAHEAGKGTLRFPLDRPIPYDLIEQVVRLLVEERRGRAQAAGRG